MLTIGETEHRGERRCMGILCTICSVFYKPNCLKKQSLLIIFKKGEFLHNNDIKETTVQLKIQKSKDKIDQIIFKGTK